MDKPAPAAKPSLTHIDRPDCAETFADSINGVVFDGQTLRIEFGITRMDEMKKDASPTGRRYPACRLVLPPGAAIDLINRMQQIAAAMQQAGILKPAAKTDDRAEIRPAPGLSLRTPAQP